MIAVVQRRICRRQQPGEPVLALDQGTGAEILAVEVEQIEQEEHEAGGVAGIDANWIMLNEVMPSGRTPRNSPSR